MEEGLRMEGGRKTNGATAAHDARAGPLVMKVSEDYCARKWSASVRPASERSEPKWLAMKPLLK